MRRIFAAKGRPIGHPLIVHLPGVEHLDAWAREVPESARALAARFWPGPLTLVLPAVADLDAAITAGTGTVAVRVPGSELARSLARRAGGAIVSTSANLSGEPPPTAPAELSSDLVARVDHVLDGGRTPGGQPSTIVEVTGDAVRVLREGVIPAHAVRAACAAA